MKTLTSTLGVAMVCAAVAWAQEPPVVPDTPAAVDSPSLVAPRDPFWPVGYWPQPETETPEPEPAATPVARPPTPQVEWPKLSLKAVSQAADGRSFAIIDGIEGIVQSGSVISMQHRGHIFTWRILDVSEKGVTHAKLEARPATGGVRTQSSITEDGR